MARKPTVESRKPVRSDKRDRPRSRRSGVQAVKRPGAQDPIVTSVSRTAPRAPEFSGVRDGKAPKRPGAQAPIVASEGRPDGQAPKRSGARVPIVRADGRELRKLHVYVGVKTAKQLAMFCAEVERNLSDVVEEAVLRFLAAETK